ncbi:hypothetical protein [Piscinibacterium candidicorallinum]|jgi:hypothetical protein|uniref:Uncharacterized protein n=1 Tax=Piscinibacterium candidicorallinum TaxID=1793872 RepID=A0ABV7H6M8_9BURK
MQNLPVIVIEGVLVFGGVLAFAWWQLRELKQLERERERKKAEAAGSKSESEDPKA